MQILPGRATLPREDSDHPPIPPVLGIVLGLIAFSTSSIMTRYAQGYAASLVIAAYRLSLATLILGPLAVFRYRRALRSIDRRQLLLSLSSGAFLAMHFGTWITSLEYTTVASSLVLVWTSPLFVALLSPLALGESITRPLRIGLPLALIGSLMVGLSDACTWQAGLACPPASLFFRGTAIFGDMLALAGAVAAAGYILLGRRLRRSMALVPYVALAYGAAAVLLLLGVGAFRLPVFGYPLQAYGWFVLLAILPQLVAHSTYNWALRYLPAAFVSIASLGEPVGATVLAFFLLGERPAGLMLVGGLMILAGILIASRRQTDQPGIGSPLPSPG